MLRGRNDVGFHELGTTDELEALNRYDSNDILDVSKVRAHLRRHHDLPSTASLLWPASSHITPSDAAKQHPPLFLVKLPPRCPSDSLLPSKPAVLPSHDPLSRSSLASPRKKTARRSFTTRHSREYSISSTSSSQREEHRRPSERDHSPKSSPISFSSQSTSPSECSRPSVDSSLSPYHESNALSNDNEAAFSLQSPSECSSSAAATASSSLPSPRSARVIAPHTNPLPRSHSDTHIDTGRARSFSCDMLPKSHAPCTLIQRRPRSCHTSPQTALTLMDEYFLERIETHVSILERMRDKCVDDGHANGPVVAVTNWQHAEDYPKAWISKLKQLITDPRFPEPMYLETDADADDDEIEGVLMSLIRNEDNVVDETPDRRRVKSLSVFSRSKSSPNFCMGRMGSLVAVFILLVIIVTILRWYSHMASSGHGHAPGGGGAGGGGHGPRLHDSDPFRGLH